jgi:hypothetical protein
MLKENFNMGKIKTIFKDSTLEYDGKKIIIEDKKLLKEIIITNEMISNNEPISISMKKTFFSMLMIIHSEFKDIVNMENYIIKYIKNNLMSSFIDLSKIEKNELNEIEKMISLKLWNLYSSDTQESISEKFEGLNLNKSELFNINFILTLDEVKLNGIIQKNTNIKELFKNKDNKNGNKR